ncbi:MAG: 30S ribosomal protein S8 [Candidatus Spechtbacterales bacterium]
MDTLADMLTSIRNAQAVNKEMVKVPFSNKKFYLAKVMEQEGFIKSVEKKGTQQKPALVIALKYTETEKPAIGKLKRISTPGQRIYVRYQDIKPVRGGHGKAIISTPKGIMTGESAKKQKVGGEYIAQIW